MAVKCFNPSNKKAIELTLCTTCARQFYNSKSCFIRRADLWQAEREVCMFCNTRLGFDFLISDIECGNESSYCPRSGIQ